MSEEADQADLTNWPHDCYVGIEEAIAEFKTALPGWWYSMGDCQVTCHASCAPTDRTIDMNLIEYDDRFNSGFHADVPQPTTLATALRAIMTEALEAKAALPPPSIVGKKNRIKELRKALGLTQEALGELAGISRHEVSSIERGMTLPRLSAALQICKALNGSLASVFHQ